MRKLLQAKFVVMSLFRSVFHKERDQFDEVNGARNNLCTYCGMIVRERIVKAHVFKIPLDMSVKETLDLTIVELGIYKYGPNIRFDHIRQCLSQVSAGMEGSLIKLRTFGASTPVQ
jgi:hypothetical protein